MPLERAQSRYTTRPLVPRKLPPVLHTAERPPTLHPVRTSVMTVKELAPRIEVSPGSSRRTWTFGHTTTTHSGGGNMAAYLPGGGVSVSGARGGRRCGSATAGRARGQRQQHMYPSVAGSGGVWGVSNAGGTRKVSAFLFTQGSA